MKITVRLAAILMALEFLAGQVHEMTHHVVARLVAGSWGRMTFNRFFYPAGFESDVHALWATAAGPLLTYALIYAGLALLRTHPQTGQFLIFANLPLARLVTAFSGHGDEVVVARGLGASWIAGALAVAVAMAWPLIAAWRANPHPARFAFLFVAPMAFDGVVKIIALERLLSRVGFAPAIAGVPLLVIAIDLLFLITLLVISTFRTMDTAPAA